MVFSSAVMPVMLRVHRATPSLPAAEDRRLTLRDDLSAAILEMASDQSQPGKTSDMSESPSECCSPLIKNNLWARNHPEVHNEWSRGPMTKVPPTRSDIGMKQ
jgi:hypothetical protein